MIDLDKDLAEAKEILFGATMLIPERRHLIALQNHFDDSLIVLAMETAKLHDRIMATE